MSVRCRFVLDVVSLSRLTRPLKHVHYDARNNTDLAWIDSRGNIWTETAREDRAAEPT